MIFLNAWAFGLLGLAGVVTALYFLRRREERLTVSALWLWRQEPEHPRSALIFVWTNIGLLLVQLAALAALVFALAAPTLPQEFFGGGTLAVIVDGSASMQTREHGQSRYERAIALAREIIERRRPSHLTIIQAQQTPRLLVPWTQDHAQALAALHASRPTLQSNAAASQILQILRSQRELENFDEIFYISDHPPESLAGTVRWVPVGASQKNGAITGFAARRLPQSAQGVALWATVENLSAEAIEGTFRFFAEETEILTEHLRLAPGERRAVEAQATQSLGGRFRAVLEVADDFPFDNARYALIPTRPNLKILWLGEGNFFLEQALNIFAEAEITTRPTGDKINAEDYDLVIVHNTELHTPPSGRFLFLNSPVASIVQLSEEAVPTGALQLLQPAHPLMQNVRLEHLQTPARRDATFVLPVQTVIASEGQPIVAAHRSGSLNFVWLGIALRASPLVLTPSFPILVKNITRWLLAEASLPLEQWVSEEFPAPGFVEQGAVNLDPTESREILRQPDSVWTVRPRHGEDEGQAKLVQTKPGTPIWYYGAWLALGLLALELLLYYNRGLVKGAP
jgi:Ca-activated chloride channel family protein